MTTKRSKVSDGGQVYVRTSPDDDERLLSLMKRIPLRRSTLAREAMRLGLAQLEADPAAIVAPVQSH